MPLYRVLFAAMYSPHGRGQECTCQNLKHTRDRHHSFKKKPLCSYFLFLSLFEYLNNCPTLVRTDVNVLTHTRFEPQQRQGHQREDSCRTFSCHAD